MQLQIKNFRRFDENGVTFDLAPITFLTGENSSGKSSLTKAVMLLQDYFNNAKHDSSLIIEKLNFQKFNLGGYDYVKNYNSSKEEISIGFCAFNRYLNKQVKIEYIFAKKDNDFFQNGYLKQAKAIDEEGNILLFWDSDNKENCYLNGAVFKQPFLKYAEQFLNKESDGNFKQVFGFNQPQKAKYNPFEKNLTVTQERKVEELKFSIENKIIFSLPIVRDFVTKEKEEVLNFLSDLAINSNDENLSKIISKLSEPSLTFTDYIKEIEDKLLKLSLYDQAIEMFDGLDFLKRFDLNHNSIFDYLLNTEGNYNKNKDYKRTIVNFNNNSATIVMELDATYTSICFEKFIQLVLENLFIPDYLKDLSYIKTLDILSREFNTTYNSLNSLIFDYYEAIDYYNKQRDLFCDYKQNSFVNKWLKHLNIADEFSIRTVENSLNIYLVKNGKERLLSQEGYGIIKLFSILLSIETAILKAKWTFEINDNDEPISTCFPQTILLEEPEAHLHPKFQSVLCDIFYDAHKNYNIHFIIETHSEYLIRKSQVIVSKMNFKSNEDADNNAPFKTYYFPQNDTPYSLQYRKDGKFVNDFGKGFFDEAANLAFEIL